MASMYAQIDARCIVNHSYCSQRYLCNDLSQVSPKCVILSVTSSAANLATSMLEQRGSSGIASSGISALTFSRLFRSAPRQLRSRPLLLSRVPKRAHCSRPSNV